MNLAALADPNRQRIVELLAARELSSGEIAGRFAISAPAISQHLQVLKQAQFIRSRIDGQRRIYQLNPAGFRELENWLAGLRQFWQGRLDRLESQLRAPAATATRKRHRRKKRSS